MAPPKKTAPKTTKSSTAAKSKAKPSTARASAKPKAAPKKRKKKSKRGDSFLPSLLTAFIAGLLMAAVCFFGITHINEKKNKAQLASHPPTQSVQAQRGSDPGKGVLPRINEGKDTQGKISSGTNKVEGNVSLLTSSEEEAIASALVELQALPYEEALHVPLDERIRQVDYALMQAAWQQNLPATRTRLASVQDKKSGQENYHFQTIDILPGKTADSYIQTLRENLQTWSGNAILRKKSTNEWLISLDGIDTHHIRLYPGQEQFTEEAQQSSQQTPRSSPALVRPSGQTAKLVIVIDDLGESMQAIDRLLRLEYPVTFAFWPHASHVAEGAKKAHKKGKEILVHLPMEPLGYPNVAPGPGVLLTNMSSQQITRQVEAGIAKVPHAVGLNNHMGSRFTQNKAGVDAVIAVLKQRRMFMLDSMTDPRSVFAKEGQRLGITHYKRNVFLDVTHSRKAILAQLRQAERIALLTGQSIAIGHPLPETLSALEEWQRLRDRSVRIVRLQDL